MVTMRWNLMGMGTELKQAICDNQNRRARAWNRKQDEQYLQYCIGTGDAEMIAYAARLLGKH